MKVRSLGEFGLIERLSAGVDCSSFAVRGIGDDCAHHRFPAGEELLTSMDLLLEGVHFRRDWATLEQIGRKSVAVNVSDVAAMGGTPRFLYLGLALPVDATVDQTDAFMAGFLEEAASYGATLVGGDTCRSAQGWVIAVTVEGTAPAGTAMGREGAQVGDDIYVSGTLGDSALCLHCLQTGRPFSDRVAQRHFTPTARVRLGQALRQSEAVHAMIDLSDGALADVGHILKASSVGATLALDDLPLSDDFAEQGGTLEMALGGGEDYELLFCAPSSARPQMAAIARDEGVALSRIGAIHQHNGRLECLHKGKPWQSRHLGFNHFHS